MLVALCESEIKNRALRVGRQHLRLADMSYRQMREIAATTMTHGEAGSDLQLLLAVGQLWGESAIQRLRFVDVEDEPEASMRLGSLFARLGARSSGETPQR
jgi:hypothetical protein